MRTCSGSMGGRLLVMTLLIVSSFKKMLKFGWEGGVVLVVSILVSVREREGFKSFWKSAVSFVDRVVSCAFERSEGGAGREKAERLERSFKTFEVARARLLLGSQGW